MNIRVTKDSKIYILSPGKIASGGPEALHQLCHYFTVLGYNASLCYWINNEINPSYKKYNVKIENIADIADRKENVIITPEIYTKSLHKYNNIQKVIWWLGLQYYDGFDTLGNTFRDRLNRFMRRYISSNIFQPYYKLKSIFSSGLTPFIPDRKTIHLCGSKFAYEFVSKYYKNVKMLVEPISITFLNEDEPELSSLNRSNVILYNPSKPSEVQDKLLNRPELQFYPLKGLNTSEMISLFRKSKLYIDFGMFGGPERLPKETVYNGTMILVGKRNAAINDYDVAIPEEYKINDFEDIDSIVEKILHMLDNYDVLIHDFSKFRNQISGLEKQFISNIESLFPKI